MNKKALKKTKFRNSFINILNTDAERKKRKICFLALVFEYVKSQEHI